MILSSAIHLHPLDYSLENIRSLTNEELALAPFHPDIDDHDESTLLKVHRIWSNRRERYRLNSISNVVVEHDSLLSIELSFSLSDLSILTSEQLSIVQFHPDVNELIQLKAEKVWRSRREKDLLKGFVWEAKKTSILKKEEEINEAIIVDEPEEIQSTLPETSVVVLAEPLVELEPSPIPHSPVASTSRLTLEQLPPVTPTSLTAEPTSNSKSLSPIQDAPLPTLLPASEEIIASTIRAISPRPTLIIETSPIPEVNRSISRSPMSIFSSSVSPPPIIITQSIKLPPLPPSRLAPISLGTPSLSPPPQLHTPPIPIPTLPIPEPPPVKVLPPKPASRELLTNSQNQQIFSLKLSNLAMQVVANSSELFKLFPVHLKPDAYILLAKRVGDLSREGYVGYSTFERRTEAMQTLSLITLRGNWRVEVEYVDNDVPKWVWSELTNEFADKIWRNSCEAEELKKVRAGEVEERLRLESIRKEEDEAAEKEIEKERELKELARKKEEEIAAKEIEKERQLRLLLEAEKLKRELSASIKEINRIHSPSPKPVEFTPQSINDCLVDPEFIDTFFPLTCTFLVDPRLPLSSDGVLKFPKQTKMKHVIGGQRIEPPRIGYHFLFASQVAQSKAKDLILADGLGGTLFSVDTEAAPRLSWKFGMLQQSVDIVMKARKLFYSNPSNRSKFTAANLSHSSSLKVSERQVLPVHSYFPQNPSPLLPSQPLPSPVLAMDDASSSIKSHEDVLTFDENTDQSGRALPQGWRRTESKSEPGCYFFVNDNVEVDGATWINPLDNSEESIDVDETMDDASEIPQSNSLSSRVQPTPPQDSEDDEEELLIIDNSFNSNGSINNKSLQSQTRNEKLFPKFVPSSTATTNNYYHDDEDEDELSIFSHSNNAPGSSKLLSLPTWNTSSVIPQSTSSSALPVPTAASSSLLARTLSQPLNPPSSFVSIPSSMDLADRLHMTAAGGTLESLVNRIVGGSASTASTSTSSSSSNSTTTTPHSLLPPPSPNRINSNGPRWATQTQNQTNRFNSSNRGVGSLNYKNDTRTSNGKKYANNSNNNNNSNNSNNNNNNSKNNSNGNNNNGGGLGLGARMRDGIGGSKRPGDSFDSVRNGKKSKGGRGGGEAGGGADGGRGIVG